jgi:hypothetical protein
MYRELPPIVAPEADSGVNDDHVPSGVAVFPVRILTATTVPVGRTLVHDAVSQLTDDPASRTRDVNVAGLE